jgi:excisionase family DNA binding protein
MLGEDDFKLAYSPNEACAAIGCGRSKLYEIIREGHLDARQFGRCTRITAASLRAYIESLPKAEIQDIFERQGSAAPAVRGRGYKRAKVEAAE